MGAVVRYRLRLCFWAYCAEQCDVALSRLDECATGQRRLLGWHGTADGAMTDEDDPPTLASYAMPSGKPWRARMTCCFSTVRRRLVSREAACCHCPGAAGWISGRFTVARTKTIVPAEGGAVQKLRPVLCGSRERRGQHSGRGLCFSPSLLRSAGSTRKNLMVASIASRSLAASAGASVVCRCCPHASAPSLHQPNDFGQCPCQQCGRG
jgi:hypothetical protein